MKMGRRSEHDINRSLRIRLISHAKEGTIDGCSSIN